MSLDQCKRKLENVDPVAINLSWDVFQPLRRMILEGKPNPIPGCGPIVPVVVCCECLELGEVGWLGPQEGLATHLREKHKGIGRRIDSIPCLAQKVSDLCFVVRGCVFFLSSARWWCIYLFMLSSLVERATLPICQFDKSQLLHQPLLLQLKLLFKKSLPSGRECKGTIVVRLE